MRIHDEVKVRKEGQCLKELFIKLCLSSCVYQVVMVLTLLIYTICK